jgi:hypothetical protein
MAYGLLRLVELIVYCYVLRLSGLSRVVYFLFGPDTGRRRRRHLCVLITRLTTPASVDIPR